ncbi:iron-sulfur cluster biosynthesis transcriptional regulator SufR [Synechococcus sp. PCC 7335]|nr:iron-sulfur cluster biosynthesis transcriptional regulator SufR [Synechococcus sp. PCC 7335]
MRQKVTSQSTSQPSTKVTASRVSTGGSSSMREDILRFLLKRGTATAGAIARHLDITPQGIRRHLKNLETDGLIEHQTSQAGIGRPNHVYKLSRKGREQFPDQYDQFALSLLDTVADTLGPEHVSKLLRHQWQQKAAEYRKQLGDAPLNERMQTLVKLRQAEGYMAECYPADDSTDDLAFVITEYNCAIAHIAESYPTVCGHELAMFALALPDCSVERTHWLVDGEHQCGYLVKMRVSS